MHITDFVFMAGFLLMAGAVLRAGAHAVRRRWASARRILLRAILFALGYTAIVVATSLATPRRWIQIGEEQRFDDWAATVVKAERSGERYRVVVRVANHGRGRPQRAADAELILVTSDGRRLAAVTSPDQRSMRSLVQPGESFETAEDFEVPSGETIIGADLVHGAWPELFIIGDRGSLFFKRPLVRLP